MGVSKKRKDRPKKGSFRPVRAEDVKLDITLEDGKTHRVNILDVLNIMRNIMNNMAQMVDRLKDEVLTLREHTGLAVPEEDEEAPAPGTEGGRSLMEGEDDPKTETNEEDQGSDPVEEPEEAAITDPGDED